MILKCQNCGGALKYSYEADKLVCAHCASYYEVSDFDTDDGEQEMMDSEIYQCTSCGAELILNNVESATYCAYCGQPTIVFDRVAKVKRPKYIVPFCTTKEQAYEKIKARFRSGRYVPKKIKNFTPDLVRGVYIPFMLYDVDYEDKQLYLTGVRSGGRYSSLMECYREAKDRFINVTVDASVNLNDESSQRLEPFDLSEKKPFHVGYLSGYYADCADEKEEKMRQTAVERCVDIFQEAVEASLQGNEKTLLDCNPKSEIVAADYAMLPVWFVVFHENEKSYTVMVNGQTGKVVGTAPFQVAKIKRTFIIYAVIGTLLALLCLLPVYLGLDFIRIILMTLIMGLGLGGCWRTLWKQYSEFMESETLATAESIRRLATDRQGE